MVLLDLFCGAGGAAAGYCAAGFDRIYGVDVKPQPHYPFNFILGDALEYAAKFGCTYDAIHASPPCQRYSRLSSRYDRDKHPDLIDATRSVLKSSGLPYVIENVPGSPLKVSVVLCGTSFGLKVRRHRIFETNFELPAPPPCQHGGRIYGVYGHPGGISRRDIGRKSGSRKGTAKQWSEAMGIDWMNSKELAQSVPPVFTQWIGRYLLAIALSNKE